MSACPAAGLTLASGVLLHPSHCWKDSKAQLQKRWTLSGTFSIAANETLHISRIPLNHFSLSHNSLTKTMLTTCRGFTLTFTNGMSLSSIVRQQSISGSYKWKDTFCPPSCRHPFIAQSAKFRLFRSNQEFLCGLHGSKEFSKELASRKILGRIFLTCSASEGNFFTSWTRGNDRSKSSPWDPLKASSVTGEGGSFIASPAMDAVIQTGQMLAFLSEDLVILESKLASCQNIFDNTFVLGEKGIEIDELIQQRAEASAEVRLLRRQLAVQEGKISQLQDHMQAREEQVASEELNSRQVLSESEARVKQLSAEVASLTSTLNDSDKLLSEMRDESELTVGALQQAAEALEFARGRMKELEGEMARQSRSEAERLAAIEEENAQLAELLATSRGEVAQLNRAVRLKEDELREQLERSSASLADAAEREHTLRLADARARQLDDEVAALQEELKAKNEDLTAASEETTRTAEMLRQASATCQELALVERQLEMTRCHVSALQEQIQAKDALLEEVRDATANSMEALRTASLIKQELNGAREREAQLREELEGRDTLLAELRRDVAENLRAQRAEQVVRQLEVRVRDAAAEVAALRKGVEQRDEAMALIQLELQHSATMLTTAARDRQALRALQQHVLDLEEQASIRDRQLAILQARASSPAGSTWSPPEEQYNGGGLGAQQ